jgi:nucleoside phosphorylase
VDGFPLYDGGVIIVCKTGIGRRSQQAAEAMLTRYSARMVLSVGVAGGLAPGMSVGDLVICSQVDHETHRHRGEETSVYCDEGLMRRAFGVAESIGLPITVGGSLTVDEAAWGSAEKAAHHAWKRHDIVEMESFWIGEAAVRRGIPFLTARTISDTADHELYQTGAMREDGTFDAEAFQAWAQAHPELMPGFAMSAANARFAFSSLTRFLSAFLPQVAAEPVL